MKPNKTEITKSLQSSLAGWATACVTMSMIVPLTMWLTIMGVSSWDWNVFTMKCVGLTGLMIATYVLLEKIRKGSLAFVRLGWLIASCYFGIVVILVAQFFEDLGPTIFFAAPEVVGVVICSSGFVHAPSVPEFDWLAEYIPMNLNEPLGTLSRDDLIITLRMGASILRN